MVQDDVLLTILTAAESIGVLDIFVPEAASYVSDDHIAGIDDYRTVTETDAVSGSALSGNCDVVVADAKWSLKVDVAVDFEDDDSRTFCLYGFAKTAGAIIVEVGDNPDFAAAASGGVFSETFSTWKCKFLSIATQRNQH